MAVKTLITGGAGFIGSHLACQLKAKGRRLLLVDDLSTGRRANVEDLLDHRCTLIEARAGQAVADPALLAEVDEVYHLAAAVGVKLVTEDPAGMIHNNINETLDVLEAARKVGATLLIASSSEVYGTCPTVPLREDMELVYGPTTASRWSYGLTKALDEHLTINLARTRGLRTVIVRLFNTIGPGQVGHYGMVVPRFVDRAVADQPVEVYGDGTQTRTFCDVRDVTSAMIRLVARPECHGQVFNLGSDHEVTINELADRVVNRAGSRAGKVYLPYEAVYGPEFEDPRRRVPDVAKIRQAIGFAPRYSLDQTLGELIQARCDAATATPAGTGPTQ